jgi:hypothetical protein
MIKVFNKHYQKSLVLLEEATGTEKLEIAEKVTEWLQDLPEEYLIALALFFNEVIDDLGDDSLDKIHLGKKGKRKRDEEEEEEEDEYDDDDDEDEYDDDDDKDDRDDY